MRILLHYIIALTASVFYGAEVCPYLESLTYQGLAIHLAISLSFIYALRSILLHYGQKRTPANRQVWRQFFIELLVFVLGGLAIAWINMHFYQFPFVSGLKLALGLGALGFFLAVDSALAKERKLHKQIAQSREFLPLDTKYFPLTRKMAVIAVVAILLAGGIISLVLLKDISLDLPQQTFSQQRATMILVEMGLIIALLAGEIINIILSFARNLRLFLQDENKALAAVAQGVFGQYSPVTRNDELGQLAHYTNNMIRDLENTTKELEKTQNTTIIALTGLAEARDNETGGHIRRTQDYVRTLAEYLNHLDNNRYYLEPKNLEILHKSAPLHDIGKVGIPDAILLKPAQLTLEEFETMKQHTTIGKEALHKAIQEMGQSTFLATAQQIAYSHHEKWDGTGYPQGLGGEDIPLPARLMAVADVYDALISKRVYKPAFTHEKAKEILMEGSGSHFDPTIIKSFLAQEDTIKAIAQKYRDE